ncbi:DUF6745 domain-containing protein [Williamsia deligens]|uniref:DUF6745 domain-containing protein n=1 Tax=Williamsia deligens TaxID=321325 RepID=A0ABW3G0Q5_9NOCA|nr:hypothetical protein [Williamsia deligens]
MASEDLTHGTLSIDTRTVDGAQGRLAHTLSSSRSRINARIDREHRRTWGWWEASTDGRPSWSFVSPTRTGPRSAVRAAIWESLHTSLSDGVAAAVRGLLPPSIGAVTWHGQQEAYHVAYQNYWRRSQLVRYTPEDDEILDLLVALTSATGWWWAFDDICVMAERPTAVHMESIPNQAHDQRRLHHDEAPAVQFADGTTVFALHGTVVPGWVMTDPDVERIARERNVEVRRCAIERIGWDTYVDTAGLALIDRVEDPGNAGNPLSLYATPDGWGRRERILLVTNGSVERDGRRRRYGLPVPPWTSSALQAAGWTYGISAADYARLLRRT